MIGRMARLTGDWQRLARYIADRRAELGLTYVQVKERGGPSPATQSLIENGQRDSMQAATAGGYERALRWAAGSIRAVLGGTDPTPAERPASRREPRHRVTGQTLQQMLDADPEFRAEMARVITEAMARQGEERSEESDEPGQSAAS
jgi:hypothetical protein